MPGSPGCADTEVLWIILMRRCLSGQASDKLELENIAVLGAAAFHTGIFPCSVPRVLEIHIRCYTAILSDLPRRCSCPGSLQNSKQYTSSLENWLSREAMICVEPGSNCLTVGCNDEFCEIVWVENLHESDSQGWRMLTALLQQSRRNWKIAAPSPFLVILCVIYEHFPVRVLSDQRLKLWSTSCGSWPRSFWQPICNAMCRSWKWNMRIMRSGPRPESSKLLWMTVGVSDGSQISPAAPVLLLSGAGA